MQYAKANNAHAIQGKNCTERLKLGALCGEQGAAALAHSPSPCSVPWHTTCPLLGAGRLWWTMHAPCLPADRFLALSPLFQPARLLPPRHRLLLALSLASMHCTTHRVTIEALQSPAALHVLLGLCFRLCLVLLHMPFMCHKERQECPWEAETRAGWRRTGGSGSPLSRARCHACVAPAAVRNLPLLSRSKVKHAGFAMGG